MFTTAVPGSYWILNLIDYHHHFNIGYVIPSEARNDSGGSSYGIWGTNIGLIVGLLSPSLGFLSVLLQAFIERTI
jgi:uncharacterized protein YqgC (DUF456 family)